MLKNPNYVYGPSDMYLPVKLNFGEFMLSRMEEFKNKPTLINGLTNEGTTYGEIGQRAMNLAVSLTSMGVRKGDVVGIMSENRVEFWSTVIGVACTGAIITTINLTYFKGELKHALNISKPKHVFCSPYAYKNHGKSLKETGHIKNIILYGNEKQNNTLLYNDIALKAVIGDKVIGNVKYEDFEAVDVVGQVDTLFILFSSGTTGLSKGVMLTHMNVLTVCTVDTTEEEEPRPLTITPWFHAMGLMGTLMTLTNGRTLVYLPEFKVDSYMSTIEKYKINRLTVVPPVLVALCKTESKYDLSSVNMIYSGAAPLHKDTLSEVQKTFPNVTTVYQGYGLSETTLAVTKDKDLDQQKPGGVGKVQSGLVVKVVDPETRKPLGPNQPGEIYVKGPMIMKGYIGIDRRDDFDEDGFFKTGDIGYYDDDKIFFIVDRLKELIKYKGFQVPPAEIEAVLLKHEGVRDAGVVGIPHKSAGEVPLAFVVPQPGVTLAEKDIKEYVAEQLSNPKHLRGGVRFVDAIPKNPSGKILRRVLREMVKSKKSKL